MVKKKKTTGKELKKQRYKKRRILTFFRVFKYGTSNFARNAWLTAAATAVMTITLLIIFVTVAANGIMTETIDDLKQKVDMSIYLKSETTSEEGNALIKEETCTSLLLVLALIALCSLIIISFWKSDQHSKYSRMPTFLGIPFLITRKLPRTVSSKRVLEYNSRSNASISQPRLTSTSMLIPLASE